MRFPAAACAPLVAATAALVAAVTTTLVPTAFAFHPIGGGISSSRTHHLPLRPIIAAATATLTTQNFRSSTPLHMSGDDGTDTAENPMANKVAYQRFLYTLGSLSDCPTDTSFSIEERLRFQVGSDGRTLEPYGPTTYLLRDGPPGDGDDTSAAAPPQEKRPDGAKRTYARVGPILYKLNVKAGDGEEEETSEDSCVALALFLAARPELVTGEVLQLGSGSGLGGLLGCVAAGIGARKQDGGEKKDDAKAARGKGKVEEEEEISILPTQAANTAPLPPSLDKLHLTDASEDNLNHALHNVNVAGLSPSKVEVAPFDFRSRLPSGMRNKYDLILGADIAYQFPDVKHLSRTVAYALKPSPYEGQASDVELGGGRVVHVGPNTRDAISEWRRKMRRGYKMDTDVVYLDLLRYDLAPMVLDSETDEAGAELDLLSAPFEDDDGTRLGRNGYVEYQNMVDSKYTGFVGRHHMDYDGYNGEYFFPTETGAEEDGAPSRFVGDGNVERDNFNV